CSGRMPWMATLKEEKRMSCGRISRSSTRTTSPSSIQASPTEQALPRVSLAVSKSMAMVFKVSPNSAAQALAQATLIRQRSGLPADQREPLILVHDLHTELPRLVELGAGARPCDDVIGL